jgi:hypothetical protein
MSVKELQAELTKLSPQERDQVASFLAASRTLHSPDSRSELARRHRDMDAGRSVSEAELARILAAKPSAA